MKRIATLLAAACLCAGCFGDALRSDADAPDQYRLDGPAAEPAGAALPLAIAVARPRSPPSLDTNRIAVTTPGLGFNYLAGARWADAAPQMLQQLLVGALTADARFATAVAAPSRVPTDLLLDVDLAQFEAAYSNVDAPPTIMVEFRVNLVDVHRSQRVASFLCAKSVAATGNDRAAVVAAFEQATDEAIREVVSQVAAAATPKP